MSIIFLTFLLTMIRARNYFRLANQCLNVLNCRMGDEKRNIVDTRVREYLTNKVREKFPEDFHLIEPVLDTYLDKYNLRELLLIVRIEIEKLKRPPLG